MSILTYDGSENELEFFVSDDGSHTAMSQAGLSRCIKGEGHWKPLRRLLNTLDTNYQESLRLSEPPKSLEHLMGKVFSPVPSFPPSLRRKLITAEACAAIIRYFADQYTVEAGKAVPMYPVARESLAKFANHGIDRFIKQLAGYDTSDSEPEETKILLKAVLSQLKIQSQQIEELQIQVKAIGKTEQKFPGIQIVNDQVNNFVFLPADLKEPFTIREWVQKMKGIKLSHKECISFGRYVANTLTTLKLESPEKYGSAAIYRYSDIPGLMAAWQGWSKTRSRLA